MSPRDMERARALAEMAMEEALEAFRRNAHKPDWIGQGLRQGLLKASEEDGEWDTAMRQSDPTNMEHVLHCRWELGDSIASKLQAMDDSQMLLPFKKDSSEEKEDVA